MSRFLKPENALKRAKEFLGVGKPTRALDILYDVIRRGKTRNNCNEDVLQPIMIFYLELCVDQKKSSLAKEGLYQYRNIFQGICKQTLEIVVRKYLEMAEERTEAARKKSHDLVSAVDDLDQIATPEQLLLKAVSGEGAQDRSDRTILTPWVKFLWESYRQCLELLRNNSRVEKLYHEIAKKSFDFCERYQRKTEFRKLCDILNTHLQHMQKVPTSATAVSLTNPETQQMNLETRLEQLNYAIRMELWQEAYRAIEYVSDLMGKSKKSPKPQIMASYYQKISLVFLKADVQLFHAAALLKLFHLNREQKKNITSEEMTKRAGIVLTAALAIPLPSAHPEYDRFLETEKTANEKIVKLALLLNLQKPPTRQSIFKDLAKNGVLGAVCPELKNMYELMEIKFDIFGLCKKMKVQLEWVSEQEDLAQYVPAIQRMTVTRLVKKVAQVYTSCSMDWLVKLSVFMEPFELQRLLVDLVRHNDLQIHIDHRLRSVNFGSGLSESQREEIPEGPTLQPMSSETARSQLVHMQRAIKRCVALIAPDSKKAEIEPVRNKCIQMYQKSKAADHHKILQRQSTIEHRKEKLESQTLEREVNIRRAQEEHVMRQKAEEQERLKREATEREKLRKEEQIKQMQTKQKIMQISQTSFGQKMIEKFDEEEIMNLDAEEILQKHIQELAKEQKEVQQRLVAQQKKVDHMERAKRIHEIPKFQELHEKQKLSDKENWKTDEEKRFKEEQLKHARAHEMSKRVKRMSADINIFMDKLLASRRAETEKKMNDFNARLEVERKKRLAERKESRRQNRKAEHYKKKMEEEQRRIDEEMKKEKEAKDAEEEAGLEREEEEYRQRQERNRQNLREQEEKQAAEAKSWRSEKRPEAEPDQKPWRPSVKAEGEGEWRKKEVQAQGVYQPPQRGTGAAYKEEDAPPRRDERPMERDAREDRAPERDMRRDDKRPADREFGRRDDKGPDRGDFARKGDFGRNDRGGEKDFSRRDDRGAGDFGRKDDRDRDFGRKDDRGPDRDFVRRDERGSDRDFVRRDERGPDRDFARRDDKDFARRDDKGPDRGDFARKDDRDRGGDFSRRGDGDFSRRGDGKDDRPRGDFSRRDDRGGGGDRRGPDRRDNFTDYRYDDKESRGGDSRRGDFGRDGGDRDGGDSWRRGGGGYRGGGGGDRSEGSWRTGGGDRGGPARGGGDRRGVDDRKAAAPVRRVKKEPDADGWTKL